MALVWLFHQDIILSQHLQALSQNVSGNAQLSDIVIVLADTKQGGNKDQQGPAITDQVGDVGEG